jgi:N-acyl homoserine lactone hydrolase
VRPKRAKRGMRRYLADDWSKATLPVNAFVIEHPQGLCLVDTGQTAAAAGAGYFPRWYPFFALSRFELQPDDEIAVQLAACGISPGDVRWVVLTHLHTDHVGGVGAFAESEVIAARTEWERAQGLRGRLRGYLPQYWPREVRPTLVDFEGPPVGPFGASYDIAGDGILFFVPLAGHTASHAGVLARTPERTILFAGDAAQTAAELAAAAPAVHAYCASEGVVVLASHDDDAAALAEATT